MNAMMFEHPRGNTKATVTAVIDDARDLGKVRILFSRSRWNLETLRPWQTQSGSWRNRRRP
jgi:hypothetical protein